MSSHAQPTYFGASSLFDDGYAERVAKLTWKIPEWSVHCKGSTSFILDKFKIRHDCQLTWQLKFEAIGGKWETGRIHLELRLMDFGASGLDTVTAKVFSCICHKINQDCGFCATPMVGKVDSSELFNFSSKARVFKKELGFVFRNFKDNPELKIHCQISYPKPQPAGRELSTDLGKILVDTTFSDITVLAGGLTKLSAHKAILAARSPVFKAMFQTKMKEKMAKQVDLTTFPATVVKGMLEYAYTDAIAITLEHIRDWLRIADMYDLGGLKWIVENTAGSNLKVDNAVEFFQLSVLYKADRLKTKVVEFMKQNGKAVSKTSGFAQFIQENPSAVVELFSGICN